jgi:hypothetical protein
MQPTNVICAAALILASGVAYAQSWQPPTDSQRCPSRWGVSDERGSANYMGPETVLRAARLIRVGEVIELGHVLSSSMPLGNRRFEVDTKHQHESTIQSPRLQ